MKGGLLPKSMTDIPEEKWDFFSLTWPQIIANLSQIILWLSLKQRVGTRLGN